MQSCQEWGTNRVGPRRLNVREDATMAIIFAFNQNFYSGGIFPDFVTGTPFGDQLATDGGNDTVLV